MKWCGLIAMSFRSPKGSFGSLPLATGVAPVSIVSIAAATSSMWPNSSAAMFAMRS
jgi:hypothetical protein